MEESPFHFSRKEQWASLSAEEKEAHIISDRVALLHLSMEEDATITFTDELTPRHYKDDPDRHCYYRGKVLKIGEDEEGAWAVVDLIEHKLQLSSFESVLPGFGNYISAMYSTLAEPTDLIGGIKEMQDAANEFPEVEIMLDLPLSDQPQKFYVKDMPACIMTKNNE